MADTTVQQLATVVGVSIEKLITQMKSAGLSDKDESSLVSDEEKQTLLAFLKKSHGSASGDAKPKKITLRKKATSTLSATGSSSAKGSSVVNVEVRKKRTFVKKAVEAATTNDASATTKVETVAKPAPVGARKSKADILREAKQQADEASRKAEQEAHERTEADKKKAQEDEANRKTQAKSNKEAKAPKKTTRKSTSSAGKPKLEEQVVDTETETAKRKEEEARRKEADEQARIRTLEEATRIASEIEGRGDKGEKAEEEYVAGDKLVQEAFEQSLREEDKSIKKDTSKRAKTKQKFQQQRNKPSAPLVSMLNDSHGFEKPVAPMVHEVELPETISVSQLALKLNMKGGMLVKELMKLGVMATVNQILDQETASLVVEELGHSVRLLDSNVLETELEELVKGDGVSVSRAPVVTIMGHVDHGKTSLLDYIRASKVADGEAGGITQHIGAYHVETERGMITFLDTPGHAAFSAMRSRGAKATDIVVIIVAGDDGMKPQTEEAIDHAKAAGVPLIVAVNKMDKEGADIERVKNELSAKEVIPEEWGGEHQFIPVSAQTGQGIPELLEAISIQAELLELTAIENTSAKGVVIESRLSKGQGAITSVLIQEGTLKRGDMVLAGHFFGRARALTDEDGKPIEQAGPSIPVEILGLAGTPDAGDTFMVVPNEKKAKEVAAKREQSTREARLVRQQASKLENLFENMGAASAANVNVVLKADVRGSLEALTSSLNELSTDEVKVNVLGAGVGGITSSDVNLALTSSAVVFGFNVRADDTAKNIARDEGVDIRYYSVIYELIDDVKDAMSGLLAPELREDILGTAEVKDVFRSSKFGAAAGCMVIEGTLYKSKRIRVLRDAVVVYEGELESLRRFKDDVNEVKNGLECGIAVKNYNDIKEGDRIEVYQVNEISRSI
jgi:translation initiation factor IF-2